jgi:hypothetical protein
MQRKRSETRHPGWIASLIFAAGFVAGALCTSWPYASAQQEFRREDLKSVPKSFIEGGDRTLPVLKEIAISSKATADALERMERNAGDADKRHRDLMKKVDRLEDQLKQLNGTMRNTSETAPSSTVRSPRPASRSNLPDR